MGYLERLARKELDAKPFTAEESGFLKKTIDQRGGGCGRPPTTAGTRGSTSEKARKRKPTVSDVHTDPTAGTVLQEGVGDANFFVAAIDIRTAVPSTWGPSTHTTSSHGVRPHDGRSVEKADRETDATRAPRVVESGVSGSREGATMGRVANPSEENRPARPLPNRQSVQREKRRTPRSKRLTTRRACCAKPRTQSPDLPTKPSRGGRRSARLNDIRPARCPRGDRFGRTGTECRGREQRDCSRIRRRRGSRRCNTDARWLGGSSGLGSTVGQ